MTSASPQAADGDSTTGKPLARTLGDRLRDIAASWMALKTWVKLWLFFLNAVLFAAFGFLPDPLAVATLGSLPVTLALLMAMALRAGGLTRLLGLGHLVPWVPLLAYLDLRLIGDAAGPRIEPGSEPALFAWAVLLGCSLSVCLLLDALDVVRWLRGARYVLGTEEAYLDGASRLSPRLSRGNAALNELRKRHTADLRGEGARRG